MAQTSATHLRGRSFRSACQLQGIVHSEPVRSRFISIRSRSCKLASRHYVNVTNGGCFPHQLPMSSMTGIKVISLNDDRVECLLEGAGSYQSNLSCLGLWGGAAVII